METIQQTISDMQQNFDTKMAEFQNDLKKVSTSGTSSPISVSTLATEFTQFQKFTLNSLTSLRQQVALLAQNQDHFEMRSRRKILLIHGVPEAKKEETNQVAHKMIADKLELANIDLSDISRSHRMGHVKNNKPRPILVKFKTIAVKDQVWFSKTKLKNSGFTLSEFLTKGRHEAFMAARAHFGVTKSWTRDGYVHILAADGSKRRVSSVAEVEQVIDASSATGASEAGFSAAGTSKPATTAKKTVAAAAESKSSTAAAGRIKRAPKKQA